MVCLIQQSLFYEQLSARTCHTGLKCRPCHTYGRASWSCMIVNILPALTVKDSLTSGFGPALIGILLNSPQPSHLARLSISSLERHFTGEQHRAVQPVT